MEWITVLGMASHVMRENILPKLPNLPECTATQ